MTNFTEIADRAEKADGPDRYLDAATWFALQGVTGQIKQGVTGQIMEGFEDYEHSRRSYWQAGSVGIFDDELPAYTASIDAVNSIPGANIVRYDQCEDITGIDGALRTVHRAVQYNGKGWFHGTAKTEPLARLAAVCRGKATEGGE